PKRGCNSPPSQSLVGSEGQRLHRVPQPLAALVLTWALAAHGQETFKTRLSPVPIDAQLAPTVTGHGSVSAVLAGTKLNVTGSFEGMRSPATAAHLHQGKVTEVRGG